MKATGIVRRIDDLGRVVIPKEIRRTLRIREGDPLEIFTDREGEVILKKYSPIGELGDTGENIRGKPCPGRWAARCASRIQIRSWPYPEAAKKICRTSSSGRKWGRL